MGIFDAIGAATTAGISTAKGLLDSGPASALSGGGLNALFGGAKTGVKLPLPNVLSSYPTYNYVLSLGVLTDNDLNFPDTTYLSGKTFPLICKSANADPMNRVKTAYGKFDFFIDDLSIDSVIGHEKGSNTNATGLSFKITEPLSMGMFIIALQTAAYQAGHKNYRDAPYILKIEFRGNSSKGTMDLIPNTTRYMPFKFTSFDMKVNQNGSVYSCTGMPYNQQALAAKSAALKSDVSIKGKTVQEMLQTGEKSLQTVINQKMKDTAKAHKVAVPDEIVIVFPNEVWSSSTTPSEGSKENKSSATTKPKAAGDSPSGALFTKLGVSKSKINSTLVQPDGQCNALGKAEMKFDLGTKGDAPIGKDNVVYDAEKKTNVRGNMVVNPKESDFRFRQDTDIINAINQVLLNSKFVPDTLDKSKVDKDGMKDWWRIDVQVYNITTDENLKTTGTKPKLIVYRVVPYQAHSSRIISANTKAPGFENLKRQAVKVYDYIYTGKNSEILNFNLEFNNSFQATFAADNFKNTQDAKTAANPAKVAGVTPTITKMDGTGSKTDKLGGGGNEDAATRAGRLFHDAITNGKDMMQLNLDIIGDPYYIAQSGQGNYTAKPTEHKNLNADGTVNWQNGEVDIIINFRTPLDLEHATGLYKFSAGKSAPVAMWSGLYKVNTLTSKFQGGKFTQTLSGFRRPQQENPMAVDVTKTFSATNTEPAKEGQANK
jgi:hypothetical protein